jgi:hypothetical protein
MRIVPFNETHILALAGAKAGVYMDTFDSKLERTRLYCLSGPAFTLMGDDHETPLASGGVVLPWPGVGEAWVLAGPRVQPGTDLARRFVWACRHWLRTIVAKQGLHRIQAITQVSEHIDRRWFRAMGFTEPRVLLRKYTPEGQDCHLYARVF